MRLLRVFTTVDVTMTASASDTIERAIRCSSARTELTGTSASQAAVPVQVIAATDSATVRDGCPLEGPASTGRRIASTALGTRSRRR